jgi:hypothetical protein
MDSLFAIFHKQTHLLKKKKTYQPKIQSSLGNLEWPLPSLSPREESHFPSPTKYYISSSSRNSASNLPSRSLDEISPSHHANHRSTIDIGESCLKKKEE